MPARAIAAAARDSAVLSAALPIRSVPVQPTCAPPRHAAAVLVAFRAARGGAAGPARGGGRGGRGGTGWAQPPPQQEEKDLGDDGFCD